MTKTIVPILPDYGSKSKEQWDKYLGDREQLNRLPTNAEILWTRNPQQGSSQSLQLTDWKNFLFITTDNIFCNRIRRNFP